MNTISTEFPFDFRTWLVSDTHFFHANVGRYCNRPDGWQELIISNWNLHIQPGDIVFHLGDLAFGKKANMEVLAAQLNGDHAGRRPVSYGNRHRSETGLLPPSYCSASPRIAQPSWTYPQQSRTRIGASTYQYQY
jgi:hypothetical protein